MFPRLPVLIAAILFSTFVLSVRAMAQAGPHGTDEVDNQAFLVINEYLASNNSVLEDPDEPGEYPDWLELHNIGAVAVSLDGMSLVRGEAGDTPTTFVISPGLTVEPGGFLLFYADKDPEQGPQHTNFRLSKSGDVIALLGGPGGNVEIDRRSFGEQETDMSEGRLPDGADIWTRFDQPTPGTANVATAPRLLSLEHSPPLPAAGDSVTVSAVLSDDGTIVTASLVYAVDAGSPATLPLVSEDGVLFRAVIPSQPNGSLVRYYITAVDDEGHAAPAPPSPQESGHGYQVGYVKPTLVINEVMASNDNTPWTDPEETGEYPDWLELHNYGNGRVSLDGLFLTDNPDRVPDGRVKFAFTTGLSIPARGYMVFLADDDPEQGDRHLNFQLSEDGESVALYGASGLVEIDRVDYDEQLENVGYGRYPDGPNQAWYMMYCLTPGKANLHCDGQSYLPLMAR